MNTNIVIGSVAIVIILGGLLYLGSRQQAVVDSNPYSTETLDVTNDLLLNEQLPTTMTSNADITAIEQDVTVTMKTSKGDITMVLHGADAPTTVGNFVQLAEADFYDGTAFHRIIPDFMIQGGDPYSKDPAKQALVGSGDPGYKFADEINDRKLVRGSLAMANSGPNTNGSQFFIVTTAETPWLDGMHTNFGEVTSGMDVVDAISAVPTAEGGRPLEPVVVTDVVVQR